jgi:glyoxylase-like metal-dependent hydrolase (beta-lactamase superfamily II)/rhodanese-related sulfurtransferase
LVEVLTLMTPELGDRTYLIHDGHQAVVIDPQRDTDRLLALADSAGVKISCLAETHIHNDYVSGGWSLSQQLGARYLVAGADDVAFQRQPVAEGDRVEVGPMTLQAVATPGHTPSHLSYLLLVDDIPQALFSGGSLLYGSVGRTDLISPGLTEELARAQHRSALRLAALPGELDLYPTHGFGSFCSSTPPSPIEPRHDLATQRASNPAMTDDEEGFVRQLLAGYSLYPRYYAHMSRLNLAGAAPLDLALPTEIDGEEVGRRIRGAQWVIDLRPRTEFGASHVAGTVNFPIGDLFSTYVGWVVPWGDSLTVVATPEESVRRGRRDLGRIGIDWFSAWSREPLADLEQQLGSSSYQVTNFAGLARALPSQDVQILDARRPDEYRHGHIKNAINIHLADLPSRIGELPDRPTWVHCAAGYRAAVAASLLDRAGREVILVDDDISKIEEAGIDLVTG